MFDSVYEYGLWNKYDEVGLSIFPEQPSLACQPYIVTAFWHRMKKAVFVSTTLLVAYGLKCHKGK